jgi:hypothetical protein
MPPYSGNTNHGLPFGTQVECFFEMVPVPGAVDPASAGAFAILLWWFGETNRATYGRLRFEDKWRRSFSPER